MTSGTFARVRLFTDVEDITLDKWLDAENSGQNELAKKILDEGLLVEHMIAEISMDQNLADNSELKQLTDNAKATFGLIVCFDCNRASGSKDEQVKNCPNCGAKLSGPDLIHPEAKKGEEEKTKKQANHKELEKPEKQPARKGKHSTSTSIPLSQAVDEAKENWFNTNHHATGRHAVRSK